MAVDIAEYMVDLDDDEKSLGEILADFDDDEVAEVLGLIESHDKSFKIGARDTWDIWGRKEQQLPDNDDWDVLLCNAGRGGGKTRMAAEAVHKKAKIKGYQIGIIGETAAEVRDVMIEGTSGILATQKPWNPCVYNPSRRRITWKSGARAITYSGDRPDQLRGPNLHFAWLDELAKFRYPDDVWDNLNLVLRSGDNPQTIITTTPRPIKIIKELLERSKDASERVIARTWSSFKNLAHIPRRFFERNIKRFVGTRLGLQELFAQVIEDTEGALWTMNLIEKHRINQVPHLIKICVGVDPQATIAGETGIVVMGLGSDEKLYCLDDMSYSGKPEEWGSQVVTAFHKHKADMVVPETNQGGDMVISTIKAIEPGIPIKGVHASRGKRTRAEPIATYAERGGIYHHGAFSDLESELTTWVVGDDSPNRLDAYVHAATYLLQFTPYGMNKKTARVF